MHRFARGSPRTKQKARCPSVRARPCKRLSPCEVNVIGHSSPRRVLSSASRARWLLPAEGVICWEERGEDRSPRHLAYGI